MVKDRRLSYPRYRIDARNRLVIGRGPALQSSRVVEGTWHLTPAHELALVARERDGRRRTLRLKGAMERATAHSLVIALEREEDGGRLASQRVTLTGRWRADARNRLGFLVEKADGTEDRLTFQGGWEVGSRHELRYRYRRLAGSRSAERTLVFDGAWDVPARNRLVYRLAGSRTSAFEFRAALRSRSFVAQEGRVAYEVGIGLTRGRRLRRRVTLFGTWKLHRNLAVSFEVPYARGRVQGIHFEGTVAATSRDRLAVALHVGERQRLGATVTFTRSLAPDAEAFLRLRGDAQEQSAIGGVTVRF